jgi:hypothetical protein
MPQMHEIAVMNQIVNLLATVPPSARRRILNYLGEIADNLPTVAQVVEEPEPPTLPFNSQESGNGESQTAG